MYEQFERGLTEKEIRYLKTRTKELENKERSVSSIVLIQSVVGFGIAALICLLGYVSSKDKPPIWFFLLIFLLPGTTWTLWFTKDSLREQKWIKTSLLGLIDALTADRVKEERVKSDRMIEIEEREDEGACYLFEVEPKKLLLLYGQEYYPTPQFPSSDFSLIDILNSQGNPVASIIEKKGDKLKAYRTISAKDKIKDLIPYESKFLDCGIHDVETYLTSRTRSS